MEDAKLGANAAHTLDNSGFIFIGRREGGAVVHFLHQMFAEQSLSSMLGSGDFSSSCNHPTPPLSWVQEDFL